MIPSLARTGIRRAANGSRIYVPSQSQQHRCCSPHHHTAQHARRDLQHANNSARRLAARRQKATLVGRQTVQQSHSESSTSYLATLKQFHESVNRILNQSRTIPIPRWVCPQHASITLSECFGHSSFILVFISYATDDFIHLRMLAIAGSSAMLVFTYFHPHGRVLWLPFKWNLAFIAINAYRVTKVYMERYFAERLSPLMKDIYEHHFYVMDKTDFAHLVRMGTVEHFEKGEVVVAQDADNRYVRLVLKGHLQVQRDGQITYELHQGNFISEVGLHAGLLLRGNVSSCCAVVAADDNITLLRWDRTELMHLLEANVNFQRAIKAVMSWDIVSKLKSQRGLLSTGKIKDYEEWTKKRREQTLYRYKAILHNMLLHPQYLNKRKEELHKYRDIHHIDDAQHQHALREMGWTLAEFEAGKKEGQEIDERQVERDEYGWRWFANDIYFRFLG